MTDSAKFTWVEPYGQISSKLLEMRSQEGHLLDLAKELCDMGDSKRIDPFTFMAMFNRQQKDVTRSAIVAAVLKDFSLDAALPADYDGIPVVNNLRWRYMDGIDSSIDVKWDFFEAMLAHADGEEGASGLPTLFDEVLAQKSIGLAKLTMAMYWCRPDAYLPLDSNTVAYLEDALGVATPKNLDGEGYLGQLDAVRATTDAPFREISRSAYQYDGWQPPADVFDPGLSLEDWSGLVANEAVFTPVALGLLSKMMGMGGQATCKELSETHGDDPAHYSSVGSALGERVCKECGIEPPTRDDGSKQYWSIPFLGKAAEKGQPGGFVWRIRPELADALHEHGVLPGSGIQGSAGEANHWVIAPGEGAWAWEEFQAKGIAAIGWDYLGDLAQYDSKSAIASAINNHEGGEGARTNDAAACWLFQTCMKPGDVVYAKSGLSKLLGRGTVTSAPRFDGSREKYRHVVSVDWTEVGEWEVEGFKLPMKTLTGWYKRHALLDAIIDSDAAEASADEPAMPAKSQLEAYGDEQFLSEVYMDPSELEELKALVAVKRNVILQGAPGTGKTFAAERLAWAIMGVKDASRIEKVQFHQSTSYDDFVIGFKPCADGGFAVEEGPFVKFCNRAAADRQGRDYFFIIDEINRANVSKAFGELLMLIEEGHRGESLRLSVDGRRFSVPENVTIIGMMNTADRGLAMIDYALRRRFAFFEMRPALENPLFAKRVDECEDARMRSLVDAVIELNEMIRKDPALDEGFCIGHSYFCKRKEHEAGCVPAIVKYELAPLVMEYWFDDRDSAKKAIELLEKAVK